MSAVKVCATINAVGHVYVSILPPGKNRQKLEETGCVSFSLEKGSYEVRIDSVVNAAGCKADIYVEDMKIATVDLEQGAKSYKKIITIN